MEKNYQSVDMGRYEAIAQIDNVVIRQQADGRWIVEWDLTMRGHRIGTSSELFDSEAEAKLFVQTEL